MFRTLLSTSILASGLLLSGSCIAENELASDASASSATAVWLPWPESAGHNSVEPLRVLLEGYELSVPCEAATVARLATGLVLQCERTRKVTITVATKEAVSNQYDYLAGNNISLAEWAVLVFEQKAAQQKGKEQPKENLMVGVNAAKRTYFADGDVFAYFDPKNKMKAYRISGNSKIPYGESIIFVSAARPDEFLDINFSGADSSTVESVMASIVIR